MITAELKIALEQKLRKYFGRNAPIDHMHPVGGGSINDAWHVSAGRHDVFVKVNSASRYPGMFAAEAKGLELLRKNSRLTIPKTLFEDKIGNDAVLVLEYIHEGGPRKGFWEEFGEGLAAMHKSTAPQFGLDHNNYIGSLNQSNKQHSNWFGFLIEERLVPQLGMAYNQGVLDDSTAKMFESLFTKLESLFPKEPPALLHGDLWSGNFMVAQNGRPCIFDPAVYYGHREMDIGMSKLFGGFDRKFYEAYNEDWPMEADWESRVDLANLYPLLVHVNLFGGSYLAEVKGILKRFS